jgi:dihydropteroate synthase
MGIINVTPDSFVASSRASALDQVVARAGQMLAHGASILDLGGQSTRPGATMHSAREEAERVIPAVQVVVSAFPDATISIDTYYSEVAGAAVEAGATMVNDISGGNMDGNMLSTVAIIGVPYVCMHLKGTPQTMQQQAVYKDVVAEVLDFFIRKIDDCTHAGIKDVIIDPGFGFGKTIEHNFQLLHQLNHFSMLQKPLLAGLSRKSTIYKTLGTTADEALNGTTVLNTIALLKGASILRVHDVREAVDAIKLVESMRKASGNS